MKSFIAGGLALALVTLFVGESFAASSILCMKVYRKDDGTYGIKKKTISSGNCPSGYYKIIDTSVMVGPQGVPGATGPQGVQGVAGPQGIQGAIGPQGERGEVGPTGPTGIQGEQGEVGPTGQAGAKGDTGDTGPQGATGAQGADGQLGIYGYGTTDVTISTSTDWSTSPPEDFNLQLRNFTVNDGVTLTIPSGLVIRCSSEFANSGTIVVKSYAKGGTQDSINYSDLSKTVVPAMDPARDGLLTTKGPQTGEIALSPSGGSQGGYGMGTDNTFTLSSIVRPGALGGGGGAGSLLSNGGSGGGTLTVLANGTIFNYGTIRANGEASMFTGGGGGGGGIIVLASKSGIENHGTLEAKGGDGGAAGQNMSSQIVVGSGGGGGGGFIHLISPDISAEGDEIVAGGDPNNLSLSSSLTVRQGGGGGGAGAGRGGSGGDIPSGSGSVSNNLGSGGMEGVVLLNRQDPTALY